MPRHRQPKEIWDTTTRRIIWERDGRKCTRCNLDVALEQCHIDHIKSGKLADNKFKGLRTLCRRCHVLRADLRHQGQTANALRDGIIPPNWRELVWEDT